MEGWMRIESRNLGIADRNLTGPGRSSRRKFLVIIAGLCLALGCRAQSGDRSLPALTGVWRLDSIVCEKNGAPDDKTLAVERLPKEIYFSCPTVMQFKGENEACQLQFYKGETLSVVAYRHKAHNRARLLFALPNETSVPEWVFDYLVERTDGRLVLTLQYDSPEPSGETAHYSYFYSLNNPSDDEN
jgi:hypothetical protein